jgi:protein-disulfide isomerase
VLSLFLSYRIIFNTSGVITKENIHEALREALKDTNLTAGTGSNQAAQPEAFAEVTTELDNDAIIGDKSKAKIAIVEFSDYECPFCKRHFSQVYPELKANYINTGKAILTFRDYPLEFHDPLATQEALAAECVKELGGDGKYFEYHDLLYTNTTSNGTGLDKSKLYDYAAQIGINRETFTQCLDSQKHLNEIKKDIEDGTKAGVSGTPGFIIGKYDANGKVVGKFLPGAYPYEDFKRILDEELAK